MAPASSSSADRDLLPWRRKATESGMAFTLVLLLAVVRYDVRWALWGAVVMLLATALVPSVFRYPGAAFSTLGNGVGRIVSWALLTLLFFLLVTPVGLLRRLLGRDPLLLKQWKTGTTSVLVTRRKMFTGLDLTTPY